MRFHLAAYVESSLDTTNQALSAVADVLLYGSGTNGFMLPEDMDVIAGYANGEGLRSARVVAPSLLRVGYPNIVPSQRNPAGLFTPSDPNLMDLLRNPVRLRRGERVTAQATPTVGLTGLPAVQLLWLRAGYDPVPEGESFWLPYHLVSGASVALGSWSLVTMEFDQTLPSGSYLIAGIDHDSPSGIAVRIACPGSSFRPGALAMGSPTGLGGGRNHELFYGDHLGSYGVFDTDAPPSLELLSAVARTTDDYQDVGMMRLIRIGDVGAAKRFCR